MVDAVHQTAAGKYEFFVEYTGGAQAAPQEPTFYLQLDLRYPKTANGNCEEVKGIGYDDSNVIVANGIRQSVRIPIYILPGEGQRNKCKAENERVEIRVQKQDGTSVKEENACICGDGRTENCPTRDYDFCYGRCRKYPRCGFNTASDKPCVCDPTTQASKFDCGGPKNDQDAAILEESREGWYCYQKQGNNNPTCNQQAPTGAAAVNQDTTPITRVELVSPQQNAQYPEGNEIQVYAKVYDDIASGQEECKLIINAKKIRSYKNIKKERSWHIQDKIQANTNQQFPAGEDIFISIECTDVPDDTPVSSTTSTVKITAPT